MFLRIAAKIPYQMCRLKPPGAQNDFSMTAA
jgi:hypothetical protein